MEKTIIVEIGDTVEVALKGKKLTFTLVLKLGGRQGDNMEISLDSPLGEAVHRKQIGEFFQFNAPSGELRAGKITKILKQK